MKELFYKSLLYSFQPFHYNWFIYGFDGVLAAF